MHGEALSLNNKNSGSESRIESGQWTGVVELRLGIPCLLTPCEPCEQSLDWSLFSGVR